MPTLSEVFYVCLVTTVSGMIIKLASMAYKSKCKECYFCGISIKRDVELEEREKEFELTHQINKTKSGPVENI
jgi:hypothetical protein